MNSVPSKVLCIGIDAANPALLRKWAADGSLPVLSSLLANGLTGDTKSVSGFFVGSTWPSLYTGLSPAEHGFHYLVQLDPGTYEFYHPAQHGISRREPFWTHLSRAGKRVAILDVPLTQLDPEINGVQTVEWGSHDSVYGFQAHPPNLARAIRELAGDHPSGRSCDGVRRTHDDYETFVTSLEEGARRKGEITRMILGKGPWDLVFQVFTESHCVGHQCWHLHDPRHPAHDSGILESVGDPLLRVYQAIDTAIGRVLEKAGDTTVILFTGHGMAHWFGAHFLLPEMLERLGHLTPPPEQVPGAGAGAAGPGGKPPAGRPTFLSPVASAMALARWGWRRMPSAVKRALGPLRDRVRQDTASGGGIPTIHADLDTSPCFPIPNGLAVSGIRLNLKDREPRGVLDPADADSFCRALEDGLLAFRTEPDRTPLIRAVTRTGDLYHGPALEGLPDLLVEWNDVVPVGSTNLGQGEGSLVRVSSPRTGPVEGRNDYGRSGEHRPEGMFVAVGPDVRPGRIQRTVSILDYAPTIAGLLDVALPPAPSAEGSPIRELTGPVRDSKE